MRRSALGAAGVMLFVLASAASPGLAQQVNLAWDRVSDSDVIGYHVYRAEEAAGFRRLTLDPLPDPEYGDRTARFNVAYRYAVTAVNADDIESGFSNLVSVFLGPIFPHFVAGAGLESRLLLQNPHEVAVSGRFELFDSDGRPLPVELNGLLPESWFDFSVPSMGIRSFVAPSEGELKQGSLRVQAESRLGGLLLISGFLGEAAVSDSSPIRDAIVPAEWDTGSDLQTGLALANPGEEEATVAVFLRDADGLALTGAQALVTLPPSSQIARFPFELFELDLADWPRFSGTLEIRSDRPVSVLGLRLSLGRLVAVPVTSR